MRTLLFKNNVHSDKPIEIPGEAQPLAVNLTVRKGQKWADLKVGEEILLRETPITDLRLGTEVIRHATIWDVKVMSFNDLLQYPEILKLEHDPFCQNYGGLFQTMRKVYDGFLPHELVTLVFYVPQPEQASE